MTAMLDPTSRSRLAADIGSLGAEFAGVFSLETIERYVAESLEQFEDVRVRIFVPLFVRRSAGERLRALAQAGGAITGPVPEVFDRGVQGFLGEFTTAT